MSEERPARGGRPLFPAVIPRRITPWALAAVAAGLLVAGWLTGSRDMALLGAAGLVGLVVGYPLARIAMGPHDRAGDD